MRPMNPFGFFDTRRISLARITRQENLASSISRVNSKIYHIETKPNLTRKLDQGRWYRCNGRAEKDVFVEGVHRKNIVGGML
jgi:hypothetical protein